MNRPLKLRSGCRFDPFDGVAGPGDFVVSTPDNRQFRVSALAKDLLGQFDGTRDLEQVAEYLKGRSLDVSAEQLRELVETRYGPMGLFEGYPEPSKAVSAAKGLGAGLPLLLRWDLLPGSLVNALSRPLGFLFNKFVAAVGVAAIILSHILVYFGPASAEPLSQGTFLWALLLCLGSVLIHELGHSAAVSRYGGRPGSIGFGLYVLMPTFYADVTQIWRFSRRRRMVVDIGGVYFHQLAFALFAALGAATGQSEFIAACRFIDLMTVIALNPVFRFDGYWLLADWLGLPNLYRLALGHLGRLAKRLLGQRGQVAGSCSSLPRLGRRAYAVFTFYALVCNAFMILILWIGYSYIQATAARLPTVLPAVFQSMTFALQAGDPFLFLDRFLTLFFVIAFPATVAVGLGRYALNIVHLAAARIRLQRISHRDRKAAA